MSRKILAVVLLPFLLSACGETREALGLTRSSPDEFAVVDRPPLAIPPDYTLRPPQPGAPRPQEMATSKQAEQATFSNNAGTTLAAASSKPSSMEAFNADALTQDVLFKAGADHVAPDIRSTIDRESEQRVNADRHLVDTLLWWRKDTSALPPVVDAAAESQRLRTNQDEGKPANAGATPIIEKSHEGWLGL